MDPTSIFSLHSKILITAVLLCLVVLILNAFLGSSLYIFGLDFIYTIQSHFYSPILVSIFNISTLLGDKVYHFYALCFLFLFTYRKLSIVTFGIYFIINVYIFSIVKQIHKQPKAFWDSTSIQLWQPQCQFGYGYPSGHAWAQVLFYEFLFAEILVIDNIKYPWNKIAFIVFVILGVLIPFSRIYLGAHSVNQVMDAIVFSYFATVCYRFYFQQQINKLIQILLKKQITVWLILGMIWAFFLSCITPIVGYEIGTQEKIRENWYSQNIKYSCNGAVQNYLLIQNSILNECSIIQTIFGFLLGCFLISNKIFCSDSLSKQFCLYLTSVWDRSSIKNLLICSFAQLIVLFGLYQLYSRVLQRFIINTYIKYMCSSIVMFILGCLFVFVPALIYKLGIIQQNEGVQQLLVSEQNKQRNNDFDQSQ